MTRPGVDFHDDEFERAWRTLVQDDASTTAPPSLRQSVMAEWEIAERQAPPVYPVAKRRVALVRLAHLAAAAALVVAAGGALMFVRSTPHRQPKSPDRPTASRVPSPAVAPSARLETPPFEEKRTTGRRSVPPAPPVTAVMTLAVDPLLDTESLRLVRVRMPRDALQALGVALLEPEASGIVEVDLIVGDDGLPRNIRQVRWATDRE